MAVTVSMSPSSPSVFLVQGFLGCSLTRTVASRSLVEIAGHSSGSWAVVTDGGGFVTCCSVALQFHAQARFGGSV